MSKKSETGISLKTLGFYTFVVVAIVYLIGAILNLIGQGAWFIKVAHTITIIGFSAITAIVAWRFVAHRDFAWKLIYFLAVVVVIVGVVLNLIP
jgi:hypothetical protein